MNGIKLYMLFLSEVLLKIRNRKKNSLPCSNTNKVCVSGKHPRHPSARLMFYVTFKLDRMTLSPWSRGLAFYLN